MKKHILCILFSCGIYMTYAQSNDHCADAILLHTGEACVAEPFSNISATAEPLSVASDPSCGSYSGADVWFKAVMPASGALRVEVENLETSTPPSFTVYSGVCGSFTEVVCVRNDERKTVSAPSLAGETLFIRVYRYFSTSPINFSICVYEPVVPANDLCANAIPLTVAGDCQLELFSNRYATAEPDAVAPPASCELYNGGDIWFTVVMPSTGVLRINKDRGTGATPPLLAAYTGACGDFTEVFCNKNESIATLEMPSLIGETLYLRMYSYANEEGQDFSMCLFEESGPTNDDCANATAIAVGETCVLNPYHNLFASDEAGLAPDPSCGVYLGGDVWFTTTVPPSGAFRIETDDYSGPAPPSYGVYSGICGNFTELICVNLDKAKTFYMPHAAGETVYIRVYSYADKNGNTFSLCLTEPTIPPNDDCENALMLNVGESCLKEAYSNRNATAQPVAVAPPPACELYAGGDVWFKLDMPSTGILNITKKRISGATHPLITIYKGQCGALEEVTCSANDTALSLYDVSLAGALLYLRVYTYNSEEGQDFSLCAWDPGCLPQETDAGEITLCENESYRFGSQTLSETGTYTETFTSVDACDSIVTLTVRVHEVDAHVAQQGNTLVASLPNAAYQWVDRRNGFSILPGETNQSFTPSASGEFAVIVTQNTCADTSATYTMTMVGIAGERSAAVNVFPNPFDRFLNISVPLHDGNVMLQLVDMAGRVVIAQHVRGRSSHVWDLQDVAAGIYLLKIRSGRHVDIHTVLRK